ncbi:hypothetical protein MKW98_012826 [Papaver atlanticum]|uniref:RBR-type E3 ubiquitin transferase n=1 Tax=Papaver atlanticum TaxID=357466 RepID=A0AAD4XHD4_9MAGN|nr:hypothetical protein MKW98_012826 [Papaver atlanticum]
MGNTQPKINKIPSSDAEDAHQQQDNQEINNAAFFICEICTEQVPLQQRFKNKQQKLTKSKQKNMKRSSFASSSSQPCSHPFCTNCIAKYIQVKIGEHGRPDIKCPDTNCVSFLDPLSCRSFLPPREFVRWCDYLCQSTVSERYDTAYCPNPYCSEFIFSECERSFLRRSSKRNKQNISECPRCKMMFCLRCMTPCQDNHQCIYSVSDNISRRVRQANEVMFMEMVATKNWKQCPSCKFYVERRAGCRHMICRCGSEFCYACGAKSGTCKSVRVCVLES